MSRRRTLLASLAAIPLVLALVSCAGSSNGDHGASAEPTTSDEPSETVRLGVVNSGDEQWPPFVAAAAEEGIIVDLVNFGSYDVPNPALADGELDLNQFQHIIYLAQYNVGANQDLTPIGSTQIYPLGLYSTKYESVDDIPDGSEVAVPDDVSNQARALLVLQSAGLITLKDGGSPYSELSDIDQGASRVTVRALEAAITATSLPDVAAAIINNDFVTDAGLTFDDALAKDDPSDPNAFPYVNIFASRAEDATNATYLRLVEIFQTNAEVQAGLAVSSGGVGVSVVLPAAELQQSLKDVEADFAASR